MKRKNEILEISFHFALSIINYCEQLEQERKYVIAKQLLKSGTSIGANIREAQNPHSRADFISKLVIAAKEANETSYWLELCSESNNYPTPVALQKNLESIQKLLSRIISKAKQNS